VETLGLGSEDESHVTRNDIGKPTTRRYTVEEKSQAVRLVRQLRAETGQRHGAVKRVAEQLGYGVESVRSWVLCRHRHNSQFPSVES
jgi:transposase-like protein